jgi:hypothetical protein
MRVRGERERHTEGVKEEKVERERQRVFVELIKFICKSLIPCGKAKDSNLRDCWFQYPRPPPPPFLNYI